LNGETNIVDERTRTPELSDVEVRVPISRGRAVTRAILWSAPTAIALAVTLVVYPNLDFAAPSTVNRVVSYSAAIIVLPAPLSALVCGFKFARYLLLAAWPASVHVTANRRRLVLRLGPFGRREYDSDRLEVRYPFEQTDAGDDGGFEAYVPEEQQFAMFLPRITHPTAVEPLNRTLLRFCPGDEAALAAKLRPAIQAWRSMNATPDDQTEHGRDD
jgi:hypothetical protein